MYIFDAPLREPAMIIAQTAKVRLSKNATLSQRGVDSGEGDLIQYLAMDIIDSAEPRFPCCTMRAIRDADRLAGGLQSGAVTRAEPVRMGRAFVSVDDWLKEVAA